MMEPPLGLRLRPMTLEDAEAAASVVNACSIAESGDAMTTPESMRSDLTAPGRLPEDDAVLVDDRDVPVGVLQLWADVPPFDEIAVFAWVVPELWGRGLSAFLLRLGEERSRGKLPLSPPELRVVMHVFRHSHNRPSAKLFRSEGFEHVRVFRDMRIGLAEERPVPQPVPGIEIRTVVRGQDERAVHDALTEAFDDHWGHVFPPFETFNHLMVESEGARFDPLLWWLATDAGRVVGASLCRPSDRDPSVGLVQELGVRRAWRGRGIGMALLLSSFDAMRRAGFASAELGVDAESLTGATRLYERAGMHVAQEWEIWEKELRPARG